MRDRTSRRTIAAVVWSIGLVLSAVAAAGFSGGMDRQVYSTQTSPAVGFLENRGQTDAAVAYYRSTGESTTFVTRTGEMIYSLPAPRTHRLSPCTITERLRGAHTRPSGEQPSSTRVNVLRGRDRSAWRFGIPTYARVSLGEVWPGIHVLLRTRGSAVEKMFLLEPGISPDAIRVGVSGASSLRVGHDGRLIACSGDSELSWSAPVAYQQIAGERRRVRVSYRVRGREYGFALGPYDRSAPVTIDPLLQSTYLGGSGNDYAYALAVDPRTGDVVVAGRTESPDLPGVAGSPQDHYGGGWDDVLVARYSSDLTRLEQATYFGGSDLDLAFAVAVHPATGEVFIAGQTASLDLPGTAGGSQERYAGDFDAFVARFDPTLTRLEQATYLGGTWCDGAYALAVSPDGGEVVVAGYTISPDFPGTRGGAQASRRSDLGYDAFVARLDASLTVVRQATYLGGTGSDEATSVAVHPITGEIVVAGQTDSIDFPGAAGGAQPGALGPYKDGFVARLDPTLTSLRQSTYFGGRGYTNVIALAIHPRTGDVLLAGQTSSDDLPETALGAQPEYGGSWDGFVTRLDASLTRVWRTSYYGGSGVELAHALAIDPSSGDVYLGGETNSRDLPGTSAAAQARFQGGYTDGFVARFDASLEASGGATYVGGADIDRVYVLLFSQRTGELLVAGETRSNPFPATTLGAQSAFGGGDLYGGDAFIARVTPDLSGSLIPRPSLRPAERLLLREPRPVPFH